MPCEPFEFNGVRGIVCRARRPQAKCRAPGCTSRRGFFLCDYPVGPGKTCDTRFCKDHGRQVAPNVHHCWQHAKQPVVAQGTLL